MVYTALHVKMQLEVLVFVFVFAWKQEIWPNEALATKIVKLFFIFSLSYISFVMNASFSSFVEFSTFRNGNS